MTSTGKTRLFASNMGILLGIMEKRWMNSFGLTRIIVLAAAMFVFTAVSQRPALATGDVIEVFPTGDPAQDVGNIQDAVAMVNEGGTVLLRATAIDGTPTAFNFGQIFPETLDEAFAQREQNSVNIRKSVRIRGEILGDDLWDNDDGEEDLDDKIRTTVEGGIEPFRVLEPGINVVIEGLDFTCTRFKVISVIAGNRVVIKNNRFGKVTFFASDVNVVGAPRTFGIGVVTDTGDDQITLDTVLIKNNLFDLNPDPSPECPLPIGAFDPDPSRADLGDKFASGIFFGNVDAKILIRNNQVRNSARAGISLIDSLATALVQNNTVEPGPTVFDNGSGFFGSIGIAVENGFFNFEDAERTLFFLNHNKVTCSNPECQGFEVGNFFFERGRAFVTHNHINMDVSDAPTLLFKAGITLFMSDSVVAFNKIEGRSNFAILLEDTIGFGLFDLADNNRVVGNRIANFEPFEPPPDMEWLFGFPWPQAVDYALFGASSNFVSGSEGTVLDLGENNIIRGGLQVVN